MKNKKKKGFTLIELLAIIVILAIIAVITVPIILNVIENSRVGSIKDSAYGYKDAVSKYYITKLYENQALELDGEYTITDGKMTGSGMDNVEIPATGNIPTNGLLVYKNNILESGYLIIDGYKVTIENGEMKTTSKDNNSNEENNTNTDFNAPIEGTISITQDSEEWSISKVITITTTSTNANLEYQLGGIDGTWTPITSGHQETLTENTTVYARLTNNVETTNPISLIIDKIDSTTPVITENSWLGGGGTIAFTVEDHETDIIDVTCKYGSKGNYVNTGVLTKDTDNYYTCIMDCDNYYQLTATNGLGQTSTYSSFGDCSINIGGSN